MWRFAGENMANKGAGAVGLALQRPMFADDIAATLIDLRCRTRRTRLRDTQRGQKMRAIQLSTIALSIFFVAACNQAKSPDTVAKETAAAEQKASNEVAKSEDSAQKDMGKDADKVGDKMVALNNTAAKDAYNITLAQADGNRKIALAKCDALAGDAQKNCKQQADADYAAAKADAKSAEVSTKQ